LWPKAPVQENTASGGYGQQADVQVIILNVRSILDTVIEEYEKAGVDCCAAQRRFRP
jgi:hypothetical protein